MLFGSLNPLVLVFVICQLLREGQAHDSYLIVRRRELHPFCNLYAMKGSGVRLRRSQWGARRGRAFAFHTSHVLCRLFLVVCNIVRVLSCHFVCPSSKAVIRAAKPYYGTPRV